MSNLSILDKNESKENTPEIQTQSSISFFSVFTENNEKLEESKNINQIFGDDGNLEQIFGYNHSFEIENNKLKISGLEDINFEFSLTSLTKKSGISFITFEVKNLANNLTRRQRHYLQSVFYNLKESGFNIKYLDDNFSDLTQKDYVIGHRCNAGDVCDLVSSFKDNFKQDDEKIKQNLELLKNGEGDFEELKKEIISKEISNILNFRLALEHLIFTRNEILKKDNKNIDDLVLKNGLQNSVLAGNHFDEDKIFEIEKDLTDGVLIGSFSILKMLEGKLVELLEFFEEIDKIKDNKKKVELIGKVVKTSNDIFLQAEKTARKNGILSILNPRNWFGKKKEEIENKKLTKQQEIDEAMDVMVELLNYKKLYGNNEIGDKYVTDIYKDKYPNNHILQGLYGGIGYFSFQDLSLKKIEVLVSEEDKTFFEKIAYTHINYSELSSFEISMCNNPPADRLYYSTYSDLEEIFEKYEEFLKILYFQDYAFKKSKYTKNYQKVLYKKGEFYLDENVEFEDYAKKFFKEVGEVFREKQSEKTKVWERLDFEIIEKTDKETENLSEINNIFDIKIGENIFPIYVVNPIKKDNLAESEKDYSKDKVVTIGTSLQNNLDVLDELLKTSNEVNRQKLQSAIRQEVKDILVMNFNEKDWNYENKIDVANHLLRKQDKEENDFDVCNTLYGVGSDIIPVKYTKEFDLEEGVLISKEDLLGGTEYGRYLGHKGRLIKKEFISDVGVKFKYYMNGIRGINLFVNIFSGDVLNKYIIDYLVYGIEPDILDTSMNTYKKVSLGTKTYYKGKKEITKEFEGKIFEEGNFQYDEYLRFVHSYDN